MKAINKIFIRLIIITLTILGFMLSACPFVKYGPGPDPIINKYGTAPHNSSSSNSSAGSSSSTN